VFSRRISYSYVQQKGFYGVLLIISKTGFILRILNTIKNVLKYFKTGALATHRGLIS
jgi:hypothetical protein